MLTQEETYPNQEGKTLGDIVVVTLGGGGITALEWRHQSQRREDCGWGSGLLVALRRAMLTSSSILVPPGGRSLPQEQSTRPSNRTAQAGSSKMLYSIFPWQLTLPRLPVPYKARKIYFTSSERETKFLGGLSTPEILTMLDSVNTYTLRASLSTPSFNLSLLPLP